MRLLSYEVRFHESIRVVGGKVRAAAAVILRVGEVGVGLRLVNGVTLLSETLFLVGDAHARLEGAVVGAVGFLELFDIRVEPLLVEVDEVRTVVDLEEGVVGFEVVEDGVGVGLVLLYLRLGVVRFLDTRGHLSLPGGLFE